MLNSYRQGGLLERVEDDNIPLHKKQAELNELNPLKHQKPFVVCFPGDASTTEVDANSICKTVMKQTKDKARVFGFYYPKIDAKRGRFDADEEKQIAEALFKLPLRRAKLEHKTNEEIAKTLGNIVFFSHCHGNCEVARILNYGAEIVEMFNYNPKIVLGQIKNISFAPLDYAKTDFGQHLNFFSFNDESKPFWVGQTYLKDQKFVGFDVAGVRERKNNVDVFFNSFLSSKFLIQRPRQNYEHNLELLSETETNSDKLSGETRAKFVSQMMQKALLNCLEKKDLKATKRDLEKMIEKQRTVEFEKADKIVFKEFCKNFNSTKTFESFLNTINKSEKDILNGGFSLEDALLIAGHRGELRKINFETSKLPKMFVDSFLATDIFGNPIAHFKKNSRAAFLNETKKESQEQTCNLILEDGSVSVNNKLSDADELLLCAYARLMNKPLKKSALMKVILPQKTNEKPKIEVSPSYQFRPGFVEDFDHMLLGFVKPNKTFPLSMRQTRIVLNEAIGLGLLPQDIKLNGVSLHKRVLFEEAKIENGKLKPSREYADSKIEQKMKDL